MREYCERDGLRCPLQEFIADTVNEARQKRESAQDYLDKLADSLVTSIGEHDDFLNLISIADPGLRIVMKESKNANDLKTIDNAVRAAEVLDQATEIILEGEERISNLTETCKEHGPIIEKRYKGLGGKVLRCSNPLARSYSPFHRERRL